ncbi:hypothetical protein SKAU_G00382260 [Synaphobranchus kaupii]|uniref:Uncharacterized protein n=1 Tax=Synaphobranchus kaupii TaxID=118154 RepID=A0A9Q1IET8_SYNKA|nr:hypothetical protein SKAU_G00382260 [Synaphobranchus kaupii]
MNHTGRKDERTQSGNSRAERRLAPLASSQCFKRGRRRNTGPQMRFNGLGSEGARSRFFYLTGGCRTLRPEYTEHDPPFATSALSFGDKYLPRRAPGSPRAGTRVTDPPPPVVRSRPKCRWRKTLVAGPNGFIAVHRTAVWDGDGHRRGPGRSLKLAVRMNSLSYRYELSFSGSLGAASQWSYLNPEQILTCKPGCIISFTQPPCFMDENAVVKAQVQQRTQTCIK